MQYAMCFNLFGFSISISQAAWVRTHSLLATILSQFNEMWEIQNQLEWMRHVHVTRLYEIDESSEVSTYKNV